MLMLVLPLQAGGMLDLGLRCAKDLYEVMQQYCIVQYCN